PGAGSRAVHGDAHSGSGPVRHGDHAGGRLLRSPGGLSEGQPVTVSSPRSTPAVPAPVGGASRASHRRGATGRSKKLLVWAAFLAPAMCVYGLFVLYPVVQSFSYSAFDWAGPGREPVPVGFGNYVEMFADPVFFKALGNTFFVLFASLAIQLPVGLMLALIITGPIRGRRAWRAMYFVPM